MGANICLDQKGEDMVISGRILDTAGRPIAGAVLDVLAGQRRGSTTSSSSASSPNSACAAFPNGWRGRGATGSAPSSRNSAIPHDGFVGRMLQHLGRHPNRPAHLHYILKAEGFETLITHIFDPDDPYINSDAVFGVKQSLLAEFRRVDDPPRAKAYEFAGPFWEVEYDFVLARKGEAT